MNADRIVRWERGLITGLWVFVLGLLAVFAWRYSDERLYADSGYYLFRVINESGFHVEHGRWVLMLGQAIPLLGVKLGLGMGSIIKMHSLSNVVFLALSMAYAIGVLRDRRTALLIAMSQVMGLAHGLFCPVFELYYGVGLVLLFHATLTNDAMNGYQRMALAALLFIGALSSHPMAWPLLLGSLVLLDRQQRRPMIRILVLIVIAFAIVRGLTMSTYEGAQISFVQRLAFPSLVFGLFTPDVLLEQLRRVLLHYPDVLVLAVFSIVVLWRSDQRRSALVLVAGSLGLYILVGLYMPDPTHDRYREQVDYAFTAWTLLMIFARVWPLQRWRPALLILLVVCTGYRMMYVSSIAPYYEARTQWQQDLIASARAQHIQKAIIDPQGIAFGTVDDRVAPYWSTGVESLLLSAKDGAERTVSIITTDDLQCPGVAENLDKLVLRCWDVLEPGEINRHYFNLGQARYEQLAQPH